MSWIARLSLRNVRCFAAPQQADLGKVTLLVGENNSGKSTFLGCCQAFARLASLYELADPPLDRPGHFDDSPYCLGDFSTIARTGSNTFALDGVLEAHCHTRLRFTFADRHGHPTEHSLEVHFQDQRGMAKSLVVRRQDGPPETWNLTGDGFSFTMRQADVSYQEVSTWLSQAVRRGQLPFAGESSTYRQRLGADASPERQAMFSRLTNFLRTMPFGTSPIAVESDALPALARQRQYGAHPLGTPRFQQVRKSLATAGVRLGLFSDVDVRREPRTKLLELRLQQSGHWHNVVDVGYGIHTVLPLLWMILDKPQGTTFLLQQPEVHLHPTAQAVLAQIMLESPHRFVIETHSDHLIDRFRIGVMTKALAPEDLRIVYFEREPNSGESTIHNIRIDGDGNMAGEPDGYRAFFVQETNRLLGID